MSPLLRIAARSLIRARRQTLPSLLALTAGFVATALFQGFIADATQTVGANYQRLAMLGDVLIEAPHESQAMEDQGRAHLSPAEQAQVEAYLAGQADRVEVVARFVYISGIISKGAQSAVFLGAGHDAAEGAALRGARFAWNTLGGVPLQESPVAEGILVGRGLGLALDCSVPEVVDAWNPDGSFKAEVRPMACADPNVDLLGQAPDGHITQVQAQIVGVVEAGLRQLEPRVVDLPLPLAWELLGEQAVTTYSVVLRDPEQARAFQAQTRAAFAAQGLDATVTLWREHGFFGDLYRRVHGLLLLYQAFLLTVVASVGALSVLGTVSRSVLERSRELGTLRSIGFEPRHIVALYAWEGALLGGLAALLGTGMTIVISLVFNQLGVHYPPGLATFPLPVTVRVVPAAWGAVAALLVAISALASAVPAAGVARKRVAEALMG